MRVLPSIGPVAETHTVLAENSMFDFPDNTKSAIFGMGCFWGVERLFYNQKGIYSTQCKYSHSIKGSSDPGHFIFEINVGKRRIRHKTTLNLNDVNFNRVD